MKCLDLVGAYGRTYKVADDVLEAWQNNKDFRILSGPYVNLSDIQKYKEEYKILSVRIWFNDNNDWIIVKV